MECVALLSPGSFKLINTFYLFSPSPIAKMLSSNLNNANINSNGNDIGKLLFLKSLLLFPFQHEVRKNTDHLLKTNV